MNEATSESRGTIRLTIPVVVIVLFLTWGASACVTYGIISTRIDWLSQRMDTVERLQSTYVPRPEYEAISRDLTNRLERIERKVDSLK